MAVDRNPNKPGVQKKPPAKKPGAAKPAGANQGGNYGGPGAKKPPPKAGQGDGQGEGGGKKKQHLSKQEIKQWIKKRLAEEDWGDKGGTNFPVDDPKAFVYKKNKKGKKVDVTPFENAGLDRKSLTTLLNHLADQGMGRQALNYIIENQAMQMALDGPKGVEGLLDVINPNMIRKMIQSGKWEGNVNVNNLVGTDTEAFRMFPKFALAWNSQLPQTDLYGRPMNEENTAEMEARYRDIAETYAIAGMEVPMAFIDQAAGMGLNISGDENFDPLAYNLYRNYLIGPGGLSKSWTKFAEKQGWNTDPEQAYADATQPFGGSWGTRTTPSDNPSDLDGGGGGTQGPGGTPFFGGFDNPVPEDDDNLSLAQAVQEQAFDNEDLEQEF